MPESLLTIPVIANVLAGIVNAYLFWRSGGQKATKDLIDLQEKQIEALKTDSELTRQRNHELANQIQMLSLKVGELEGRNRSLEDLFQQSLLLYFQDNPDIARKVRTRSGKEAHG